VSVSGESPTWYEDDAFWAAFEPFLFSDSRLDQAAGEMDGLLALIEPPEGAAFLDQAVGVGRHAAELTARGFAVTGIDRTERYLARARELAPAAEILTGDMRTFVREGAFDVVTNLWTSFGFFDDDVNLEVARNARASLKPGGAYALEMMGKEILAGSFVPNRHMWQGEALFVEDSEVEPGWTRTRSRWTVFNEDGQRFEKTINIRCYSAVELTRLLWDAGFADVRIYGSLEGEPYDLDAERLVAIARVEES
jgi:SAM-dependent methyltransferase